MWGQEQISEVHLGLEGASVAASLADESDSVLGPAAEVGSTASGCCCSFSLAQMEFANVPAPGSLQGLQCRVTWCCREWDACADRRAVLGKI